MPAIGALAVAALAATAGDDKTRIQRIEANVVDLPLGDKEAPLRLDLKQLMDLCKVPGLSMAVIDDFRIVWVKTYGVIENGSTKPVTPRTLFQAGSISKPVAASGALWLVEHGKLSLDENVNDKLKTWKVPENEYTKEQKVTLRRLMSHTAGLTVHGFPGYDVNDALPTLVQIFDGEKPANTPPIRVDVVPGTIERYSGGGVTIEQQLVMDVTGEPFPRFMHDTVLKPLGMTDSSYEQPLPPARAAMTATATRGDGSAVHGRWHIYPEMAAAGLWTTPTDLAKFAIEIALSRNGKANHLLSEKMTREMLTPVKDEAGLGFFIDRNTPGQFGHDGADEGFQALLTMNSETGKGAAMMVNSDNGIAVGMFLMQSVAREYGWRARKADELQIMNLIGNLRGAEAALRRFDTLVKTGAIRAQDEEHMMNGLGYLLLVGGKERDSVTVFQRNVEKFPNSWNAYDSLGEAYTKAGQKDLAIANYEKSLALNPKNENGAQMLKKLRAQ